MRPRLLLLLTLLGLICAGAALWARDDGRGPDRMKPERSRPASSPARQEAAEVPGTADPPAAFDDEAADDPEVVLEALRKLSVVDPVLALRLLDQAERFDAAGTASERLRLKIDALVNAGRIGDARVEAERFLGAFPEDPQVQHIESLTGVHRRPGLFSRPRFAPSDVKGNL